MVIFVNLEICFPKKEFNPINKITFPPIIKLLAKVMETQSGIIPLKKINVPAKSWSIQVSTQNCIPLKLFRFLAQTCNMTNRLTACKITLANRAVCILRVINFGLRPECIRQHPYFSDSDKDNIRKSVYQWYYSYCFRT